MMHNPYSRRRMLKQTAALTGVVAVSSPLSALARSFRTYQIGICDWSIEQHSQVEALALAKKIGVDGVQVSLGKVDNDMHLRQSKVQQAYQEAARQYGVKVCSLAIGELNNVPYKSAPETIAWVRDSIDAAKAMGCPIVLLAFFEKGDLKGDESGQQEVIRRLRAVAPQAEAAGVTLGIESWLSANEHLKIIEAVGSPRVRVYYDLANSHKMGYDIYEELAQLGTEYICEIHAKENGYLLGQGKIDFKRVSSILDKMNYTGWVVIEGARPAESALLPTYQANYQYLNAVLNKT